MYERNFGPDASQLYFVKFSSPLQILRFGSLQIKIFRIKIK